MAKYTIKAPDGHSYSVEGPDGASDDQVRAEVLRQYPDAAKTGSVMDERPRMTGNKTPGASKTDALLAEVNEQIGRYGGADARLLKQIKEYGGQVPEDVNGLDYASWSDATQNQRPPEMTNADPRNFKPADSVMPNEVDQRNSSWITKGANQLKEGGKDFGRGILGAMGFLSGGDILKMMPDSQGGPYSAAGDWWKENASAAGLQSLLRKKTGLDLRPEQTEGAENYRKPVLEVAGGMAAGPAGTLLKRLITGGVAGGAGQAASDALGEITRLPTEIAAMVFPGLKSMKTPNDEAALKKVVDQVKDKLPGARTKVDEAYNYVGDKNSRGVVTQGLDVPAPLGSLVDELVGTSAGLGTQKRLQGQLEGTVNKGYEFASGLPKPSGNTLQPGQSALTQPKAAASLGDEFKEILDKSIKSSDGRLPQDAANKFLSEMGSVRPNGVPDATRADWLQKVATNAKLAGYDPKKAVEGFNQLINAMEVASRNRAGMGKVDFAEVNREMSHDYRADLMRAPMIGFTSGSPAAAALNRRVGAKGWEAFMNALGDPTKVDYLNHILKGARSDRVIDTLLTGAMGIAGYHTEKEQLQGEGVR